MSISCKSSVTSSSKPRNIFYVWYAELCRRSNTSPLSSVKPAKPKNDTVLDFAADRIKPEEWSPILNALALDTSLHVIAIRCRINSCKFLCEINNEDKAQRMKRRCGSLWTDYFLRSLIKSIGTCLKFTQVLSSLELDGLPIYFDYLELLLPNLRNNRTLKMLSLQHCPIGDGGCHLLCIHLRFMPNIEVLNLSTCHLSSISGQYIAGIIKHQQLNRYCESWHNSLRYEEPEVRIMMGIKRITLNNNPNIGDDGLNYILDELADDLWIKAIDMQRCSITENVSKRLIDVITYSRSLEVVDFRNNDKLSFASVERILEILEKKHQFGNDPEYQWCVTSSSLCDFGNASTSRSNVSDLNAIIQKSRSAPIRQTNAFSRCSSSTLRKTKTLITMDCKKSKCFSYLDNKSSKQLDIAKKRLYELNTKLQEEILKRKETEKVYTELQKKLQDIKHLENLHTKQAENKIKTSKVINVMEDVVLEGNQKTNTTFKKTIYKNESKDKSNNEMISNKKLNCCKVKHLTAANKQKLHVKKSVTESVNVSTENISLAQTLFQKILINDDDNVSPKIMQDDETENILRYYYCDDETQEEHPSFPKIHTLDTKFSNSPLSGSNVSLEQLLLDMNAIDEDLQTSLDKNANNSSTIKSKMLPNLSPKDDQNYFQKCMVKVN